MPEKLISGDNHIDLTYLPPDLWSSEAPNKWKLLAPRVEEMDDGLHWFVDAQDKGMWNGIGPGFLPYQRGMFGHIDEMKDLGFEWSSRPGARPRPRPRLQAQARRLLPPPGLCDLPAGPIPRADHPADRRGQHHLGCRLSAPRLHLAELAADARQEPCGDLTERAAENHQRERDPAISPRLRGAPPLPALRRGMPKYSEIAPSP